MSDRGNPTSAALARLEMSRTPLHTVLLRALLLASLAGSGLVRAAEDLPSSRAAAGNTALEDISLLDDDDSPAVLEAITRLESSEGAYAAGLSEQLLSLGLKLQSQGRHGEAVTIFKRGVHLARINGGLYCEEQIPLLESEITSHLALGQYAEADERQHYLYRVQVRSLDGGRPRTLAFMQQANWQFNAYRLGVGEQDFGRLMNMWDLYRLALNDIATREGETSVNLLPPLRGMLQAQYLISGYAGEAPSAGFSTGETFVDQQQQNRFNAFRAQSYKKGRAVILAIYDIEREHHGADSVEAAEALVMLGDWLLWHEERDAAKQAYGDAFAELVKLDDAQGDIERIFGEPAALPDLDGVRPLPVAAEGGNIVLEFGVTREGRVVDLERIDDNEVSDGKANRLMRTLRKTRFRPRFETGEPVGTDKIVRAYSIVD